MTATFFGPLSEDDFLKVIGRIEVELEWPILKHHSKESADALARLAPKLVNASLKLVKTRHIQAQSSAKRGKK